MITESDVARAGLLGTKLEGSLGQNWRALCQVHDMGSGPAVVVWGRVRTWWVRRVWSGHAYHDR